MTTAVIGGQLLNSFAGAGLGIAQGIIGRNQSEDFAEQIEAAALLDAAEASRAFTKRQGAVQQAFAGGGVDVTRGTPLNFRRENAQRTHEAIARIKWNGAMRAYRAEREGDATFAAGISAATTSAARGFRTLLDMPFGSSLPSSAPQLGFGAEISNTPVALTPRAGPSSDPFALDF